jgi:hypothetical protein
MSNAQELKEIEVTIEDAKKAVARKDCLARLERNSDFKELIQDGFLTHHAIRQVLLKAHPGLQNEAQQQMIDQQITAIGGFKQFLISIYTEGMNAEQALTTDEITREELLKEGLDK